MALKIENNVVTGISLDDGITDVVIPDGVTKIEKQAFYNCYEITSVTILDTVTKIGYVAFFRCEGLTKLYLPDSVTDIGDFAFESCKNLITNLTIKQWNPKYGFSKMDYALHYMRNYQGGDPFFDNVKAENDRYIKAQREKLIRKITVSDAAVVSYLTREDWLSADDIDYLLDKLSENIEITAMLLDYKHTHFTDEYLEQRETDKFQKEVGIKERTLAEWKKIYQLGEDKEWGGYIIKKYNGTDTDVMIPDHIAGKPVTSIGKRCFSPNSTSNKEVRLVREKIRSVYIPDTVICIEESAFQRCKSLEEITIPNSVIDIGDLAFDQCRNLTGIALPESLTTISNGLFSSCRALDHIQIPKSVTHIGKEAFSNCTRLPEIDIPGNVGEIGGEAFLGCDALKRVTLHKGLKTIGVYSFSSCNLLAEIEIPESVTCIERFAFYCCYSLTEITIPKDIIRIETAAFGNCQKLKRVNLPDGLTRIENGAFSLCPNLREITIPASVTFIEHDSFYRTNDLIITAPRGSYAIGYAKEKGFKFKELPI